MDEEQRLAKGRRVRRAVLGADYVRRVDEAADPFTAPFQELVTRHLWGDVWTRPGLSRRDRSLVTLGILAASGNDEDLARHIGAAKRNGLTEKEIQETLIHASVYIGVPAANRAFAAAKSALQSEER